MMDMQAYEAVRDHFAGQYVRPVSRASFSAFAAIAAPPVPAPSKNVVGVGIGYHQDDPSDVRVKMFVRKKFALDQIPSPEQLPENKDGVPIGVVECRSFFKFTATPPDPKQHFVPLCTGVSVGPIGVSLAGTLGVIVSDGTSCYILSNNHVLANENELAPGTDILQPAVLDGGVATSKVASLSAVVPLSASAANLCDCALATLAAGIGWKNQANGSAIKGSLTRPDLGLKVTKYGRTTGLTSGTITTIKMDATVTYAIGDITLTNQFVVTTSDGSPFSEPGDSGSLITTTDGSPVGLLIGGSPTQTLASDLSVVFDQLQKLVGSPLSVAGDQLVHA